MDKRVTIEPDLETLSVRAAEEFVRLAEAAQQLSGRFTVALSGGSTPQRLYALLAGLEYYRRVRWDQVHFFWGDERCVPPEHPDSNYGMARRLMIDKLPLPEANVHRMAGEKAPPVAAAEYEKILIDFFKLAPGAWPRFDLLLMGLGEDGHTASLFPYNAALQNQKNLVVAPYVEKLQAHRITLTLPVINRGAHVWFLVAGADKAPVLRDVLEAKAPDPGLPATFVKPTDGELIWFVTVEAFKSFKPFNR
jgi:6-phosphogluconolactonase